MDWMDLARSVFGNSGSNDRGGSGWGSDVLRLIGGAGGMYLSGQQSEDAREDTQNFQREILGNQQQFQRPNRNTPYGSARSVKDPVTGEWTVTSTLDPADQEWLDRFRTTRNSMVMPQNVDFSEISNRYTPGSLGGTWAGPDWLKRNK
jgi:hypothetical protein